ncbi:MAG: hypothetical protein SCH71_11630 [Desulfobulbaceae bacterium]|nr:hypothetical protein [Desulfobulbaceae bacterium]
MNRIHPQAIPSLTFLTREDRNAGRHRSVFVELHRISCQLVLLLHLVGCSPLMGGLSEKEMAAVDAGEKTIVLLRIECTAGGQPCEPLNNVTFGLGSFETAGAPKEITTRTLSQESARMGWTYFVLEPGLYYLAVLTPRQTDVFSYQKMLQDCPRWKIDIPENIKFLYVGTLLLEGEGIKPLFGGKGIFGHDIKWRLASIKSMTMHDDHELAVKLQHDHFTDFGPVNIALMQYWQKGDPIILRSPVLDKKGIYIKPHVTARDAGLPRQTQVLITDLRKERRFQRSAAFGIPMGRIILDPTAPELVSTMIETKSDEILRRQDGSQPEEITCEILAFEIATPATLLYWDVNTRIEFLLRVRGQDREVSAMATERTYLWPSENLITRVVNEALRQVEEKSELALQELLAIPGGKE